MILSIPTTSSAPPDRIAHILLEVKYAAVIISFLQLHRLGQQLYEIERMCNPTLGMEKACIPSISNSPYDDDNYNNV